MAHWTEKRDWELKHIRHFRAGKAPESDWGHLEIPGPTVQEMKAVEEEVKKAGMRPAMPEELFFRQFPAERAGWFLASRGTRQFLAVHQDAPPCPQ